MANATSPGSPSTRSDGTAAPHPLDDNGLSPALFGLVAAHGTWEQGSLAGLERVAAYLTGTWRPEQEDHGPGTVGNGGWAWFLGRIGGVALRAAAPSTRPERRERLLALLEIWADTVFADPAARWRIGTLPRPRAYVDPPCVSAARDDRGASLRVGVTAGGARDTVLELRTGDTDPPALDAPLDDAADVPADPWGTPARIRELVALIRRRGPMPWDPAAVALLARETGMSRAAAALTLAGIPGSNGFYVPFLDAHERRVLGLKVAEADAGREELAHLTVPQRLDLLARALPDEPAALWEPDAPTAVAARIAAAWRAHHPQRTAVPETTLATVHALDTRRPAATICAAFADPDADPTTARDLDTWLRDGTLGAWITDGGDEPGRAARNFADLLADVVRVVPVVYAEVPAGDPVRDGLPALISALRARLDHPGLLLHELGAGAATAEELRARYGPEPYTGPEELGLTAYDNGGYVAVEPPASTPSRYPPTARLFLRPARIPHDPAAPSPRSEYEATRTARAVVDRVRGTYFTRIAERVASGHLPAGTYETNPAASAPDLVARVAKTLGLSTDAAALHLQLLVLAYPDDRRVRRWNGWTPARHRAAADALVTAGLVVRDKRSRAGRDVFLPGPWADATKRTRGIEEWKEALLGVPYHRFRIDGHRPNPDALLPELFATAWELVEDGRGPR